MSEEKKATWEASAAQETKPSAPAAPIAAIDEAAVVQAAGADTDGASEPENNMRARNQHVLPGILGKQLRTAYGELLNNPVPDTINDLVRKLKEAELKAAAKPGDGEGGQ
jgi:hypothetical protein